MITKYILGNPERWREVLKVLENLGDVYRGVWVFE